MSLTSSILSEIKRLGRQSLEAIKAHRDCKAGQRGVKSARVADGTYERAKKELKPQMRWLPQEYKDSHGQQYRRLQNGQVVRVSPKNNRKHRRTSNV